MTLSLLLLALFGHVFLWIELVNRFHAVAVPHWVMHAFSLFGLAVVPAAPAAFGWWLCGTRIDLFAELPWAQFSFGVQAYLVISWLVAAATAVDWIVNRALRRPPSVLRFHRTRRFALGREGDPVSSEEHAHHFLVHLPGNEILELDVTERAIDVPRLAPALDGLSIVHLSDFHFSGRVGKAYFREVVRRSNEMQADLVALTGDLIDRAECTDWIPDVLGDLTSRHGVYFVLGNHDARHGADRIRQAASDAGMIDLGGRWVQIDVRGEPVVLAGNELPWVVPAADLRRSPPRVPGGGPLRIVLSHSPDQLEWSQAHDADLLLAGHTHGGQIRLPLLGAVFSASRLGVNYVSGIFDAPPTIMHVTRGISGQLPVRLNCPPEIAHLVLRTPVPVSHR